MSHTPGPWNVYAERNGSVRVDSAEVVVANANGGSPECLANARLIAAAPELLKALKEYADPDDCDADGAPDADNSRHGETCRWCRAQSAIAKAEGKS